jgi:O-antigen/teichoic acid export membrane protein
VPKGTHPGADTALKFLALPMFLNGLVLFSFYTLLTEHRWKPLVGCMLVAVVLSIGFNLLLIPHFGFMGAIRTSTIVHLFLAVSLLPFALRVLPASFPVAYAGRWALYTVVLGALLGLSGPFLSSVPSTLIGCAIGTAGVAALGFVCGFHRLVLKPTLD